MALEQIAITDKLKAEGITESLSNGLTFETDEDLASWVDNYKSGLPEPVKKLEDYTKEELEEMAKDPQFKGAKGLQGYIDSVRAKAPAKAPVPIPPKPDNEEPEWAKTIREQNEKLLAKNETESFTKKVTELGKADGLNEKHISRVFKGLKDNATEAEIKAEFKAYKEELSDLGIKEFGTPGGGNRGNNSNVKKLAEEWRDKQKKIKK